MKGKFLACLAVLFVMVSAGPALAYDLVFTDHQGSRFYLNYYESYEDGNWEAYTGTYKDIFEGSGWVRLLVDKQSCTGSMMYWSPLCGVETVFLKKSDSKGNDIEGRQISSTNPLFMYTPGNIGTHYRYVIFVGQVGNCWKAIGNGL